MIFTISTPDNTNLSWILAKNPASAPYDRKIGNGDARRVVGKFLDDRTYQIKVLNDGVTFMKEMKANNAPAYVRPEVWIVCPFNLKAITTAFRSAIMGENSAKGTITEEQFLEPVDIVSKIGPFPGKFPIEMFLELGIEAKFTPSEHTEAHMVELRGKMPITEFLQKIYVTLTASTMGFNWHYIDEHQVDKFITLSQEWLGKTKYKDYLIKRLAGFKANLVTKFEDSVSKFEDGETEEHSSSEVEKEQKISLHTKRHDLIIQNMNCSPQLTELQKLHEVTPSEFKVVDMGSSEGKLLVKILEKFPHVKIIGLEARREKVWRIKRKLSKIEAERINIINDNILYPRPKNFEEIKDANIVIASEIIEHLPLGDRKHFIKLIRDSIQPATIILTTPNIAYNEKFGITPGEYRHYDHKIEYTKEQFMQEVVEPLSTAYDVTFLDVMPGEAEQPSFCIKATRTKSKSASSGQDYYVENFYNPLYLEVSNATVRSKDIQEGVASYPFLENSRNIFYLGPTVAPADYCPDFAPDFLEHPHGCFKYYQMHGISKLIEEPKYMGARAYLLIFKNSEHALRMGFEHPVTINSRSGTKFFKNKSDLDAIYADVKDKLVHDFIILDAEIMPWAIKSENLIKRDFILPGEAAVLWRKETEDLLLANAEKFLDVANHFAKQGPLDIRVFHMLAAGSVIEKGDRLEFGKFMFGPSLTHDRQIINYLSPLHGDIIHSIGDVSWQVNLNSKSEMNESIKRWEDYCANGGEGFVYKPEEFLSYESNGYMRQPAMKVRGKDYLRIIYGIDYLQPEYFNLLKIRRTNSKRALAIQEQELGLRMLRCFLGHNVLERLRTVAAFLGVDELRGAIIDKTL
jgi:hypothetical protein